MRKRFLTNLPAIAIMGVLLVGTVSNDLYAQSSPFVPLPVCANRGEMVKVLKQKFAEQPQSVGKINDQSIMEVFVSPSGTWTMLVTGTDGQSCLVVSGDDWNSLQLAIGEDS